MQGACSVLAHLWVMGYCSLCCRHVEAVSQAACLFGCRVLQLQVLPSNLFAVPYWASQGLRSWWGFFHTRVDGNRELAANVSSFSLTRRLMCAGRDAVGSLSCCLAAPGGRGAGVCRVPASTGRAHLTL